MTSSQRIINVGDEVSFAVSTRRGNSVNITVKEGKVIEVGVYSLVKKGKKVWSVLTSDLRHTSEPNILTESLLHAGER